MNRDAYTAMLKRNIRHIVHANIRQVNGQLLREPIFTDVFTGYATRRLVLMTNMANKRMQRKQIEGSGSSSSSMSSPSPLLKADIIVPTFEDFLKVHKDHYEYKLLPLLCESAETFAALQGICSSAGSPWVIEDRRNHIEYRCVFNKEAVGYLAAVEHSKVSLKSQQERARAFAPDVAESLRPHFKPGQVMVNGVSFEGVLMRNAKLPQRPKSASRLFDDDAAAELARAENESTPAGLSVPRSAALGFVMHTTSATEAEIVEAAEMMQLFRSEPFKKQSSNVEGVVAGQQAARAFTFLASQQLVGQGNSSRRSLLRRVALAMDVHLYERVGPMRYAFVGS